MDKITELTAAVLEFRDARDWKQFHNHKDMALSLMLEAAEVAEHFQWKDQDETAVYLESQRDRLGEELADVLYWTLLLAHDSGIDLAQAFAVKLRKNQEKYPVDKARGKHTKYDRL